MLVKMKTVARGAEFSADPGDERDVADDFGQALVDGGYAELIGAPPASKRRKAVAGPTETRDDAPPAPEAPAEPASEPAPEAPAADAEAASADPA
jgi:hypothetical protein